MSDVLTGQEPQSLGELEIASIATEFVPVSALLPSDSPRLAGEIAEHAQALAESGADLPPIVVHRPTMRIVDGMHRLRAALLRGAPRIEVRFVEGDEKDAFVLAVRLNAEHGMPLSRKDRTAAATRIMESHPHWSDRRIGSVTGLSPSAVAALRSRSSGRIAQLNMRTGRDGRSRPVNSAEGRRTASRVIIERPEASLREIAKEAGVALATARDVRERMRQGQDPVPPKLRRHERDAATEVTGEAFDEPLPAPVAPARVRCEPDVAQSAMASTPALLSDAPFTNMRKDPSLRFTEAGRALLQLLGSHALASDKRKWLIDGVPAHRNADVARAARQCAEHWLQFAKEIELRGVDTRGRVG
ncbi:ParB/RepB/Spo0J family partition protein [Streptomyces sp. NPDC014733]|uniref:ParB/RepB/Spo0J family partition protein n=1 Tax=Streptomyces sp. NPDC014733 TaxID=3364885 RepID=UPI003702476C